MTQFNVLLNHFVSVMQETVILCEAYLHCRYCVAQWSTMARIISFISL